MLSLCRGTVGSSCSNEFSRKHRDIIDNNSCATCSKRSGSILITIEISSFQSKKDATLRAVATVSRHLRVRLKERVELFYYCGSHWKCELEEVAYGSQSVRQGVLLSRVDAVRTEFINVERTGNVDNLILFADETDMNNATFA